MFTSYEVYANARRQEMEYSLRRATLDGRAIRDIPASTLSGSAMGAIRRAFGGVSAAPVFRAGPQTDSPLNG